MSKLYVGLMSGTSMDGVDAALVDFTDRASPALIEFIATEYPLTLRNRLLAAATAEEINFDELLRLDNEVGAIFAEATNQLLKKANVRAASIRAIGSHGQTVHHAPNRPIINTLQIGNPNLIAEHTGVTVVADMRRRDMAAGGQGAPLAPAFHDYLLRDSEMTRVVVNIGGIANLTVLANDLSAPVIGFDTGPGNALLDAWIQRHQQHTFDAKGSWAQSGTVDDRLLKHLISDAYFARIHPKSTGKEYFNLGWLDGNLGVTYAPQDVQATLLALTVETIARDIKRLNLGEIEIYVCGGGCQNDFMMASLSARLSPLPVMSISQLGHDPDAIEAMAFAWLAYQTVNNLPGNIPSVTGAAHPCTLGGIYPAQ